jgi:putative hydrolase of the HAD superfamily
MSQLQYLLFDLDGTLYTDETGLFAEVGKRIEHWVAEQLGLTPCAAKHLRREYYLQYGTTMAGLLRDHPELDIDAYLDFVHDVDVTKYLEPDPQLDLMLSNLPVAKAIFTNSIASWADRIAVQLGIREHFQYIFDVRSVDYHCKPHPHAFKSVLQRLGVEGRACVLLDDQPSYLSGAVEVGMRTILVSPGSYAGGNADAIVSHVLAAEPIINAWLNLPS